MTYSLGIFSVEVLEAAAASTTAQRQENLQGGIHNTSEGGKKPHAQQRKPSQIVFTSTKKESVEKLHSLPLFSRLTL